MNPTITTRDDVLTMSPHAILHYEIARAWWTQFVSIPWMQDLAGRYFAWKAKRIADRFLRLAAMKRRVDAARKATP